MTGRQWGRAITKWAALGVLLVSFVFWLLASAYGYLWGVSVRAMPFLIFIGMIPAFVVAGAIFSVGWAVFADPRESDRRLD